MADIIKNPISFDDLLNSGAHFEIDANRDDFDTELFDVDDEDIEEIDEREIEKSPWQTSFDELRRKMIPLSNFLYKKVVKEGNVEIPPNATVVVDYNAYFENEEHSYDSTYMRGKPLKINLGFGEVLPGLEDAVKTMKKGEESQFVISYNVLYGENGCPPRIKPKADVLFIIRCKDFTETPVFNTENDSKFTSLYKNALLLCDDAKSAFRRGNHPIAITKYKRIVENLQYAHLKDEKQEKLQKDMLKKCFLNLSVCYNILQEPKKACTMINNLKDLESIQNNAKALFQEGKALRVIGDFVNSRKSLVRAATLAPDNDSVANEIRLLEENVQKTKEEEILMAQRAFGVLAKSIPKTTNDKEQLDEATIEMFKTRVQEFLDGSQPTLAISGPLDPEVVKCIEKLQEVMNFDFQINKTSGGTQYILKKR